MSSRRITVEVTALSSAAVFAVLALSAFFGYLAAEAGLAELGPLFAEGDTPTGAVVNSLVFLFLVLAGTAVLLTLARRRKLNVLHLLLAASLMLSSWLILEIYLSILLGETWASELIGAASLLVSALLAALVLKPFSVLLLNLLLILYGTMAGALFATLLTPLSTIAVASTLAAYDLYSVTRGPLKKFLETVTAESEEREARVSPLRGAVLHLGQLSLGMGDVLVYSMLSPVFLLTPSFSAVRWALTSAALMAGFLMTLQLLNRRRFMPALPLPVAISLAAYVLCRLTGV